MREVSQCLLLKKRSTTPSNLSLRASYGASAKGHHITPEGMGHEVTIFLLVCVANTYDSMGLTPANLLIWRALFLLSDLLFEALGVKIIHFVFCIYINSNGGEEEHVWVIGRKVREKNTR
jgi:hypothetical protein